MLFDYLHTHFPGHNILIFYVLNFVFAAIAFQLGFARKLPLLKTILVYIMLALGTVIVTFFSILDMPMTESLMIVSLVLAIYRFRLHLQRKQNKNNEQKPNSHSE